MIRQFFQQPTTANHDIGRQQGEGLGQKLSDAKPVFRS